jgi:hypothetical protein
MMSNKFAVILALTAACYCPQGAVASGRQAETVTLTGRCDQLTIRGEDETKNCSGKMLNTTFANGRSEFYFVLSHEIILGFSGSGQSQIKLNEDVVVQPIDQIIIIVDGKPSETMAVGKCRFENPLKGSVPIVCDAEGKSGSFSGSFVTDGRAPTSSKF